MALIEAFLDPSLKWQFVGCDDGYGGLYAGISPITKKEKGRWGVLSIDIKWSVYYNTGIMYRARKTTKMLRNRP